MNQGTYPLAASMINQINRLDMISNNLANTNTNGFKQEGISEGSFNHYLQKAQEQGFTPSKINEITNTIPKMNGKFINSEQGPIMPTGNTLDFALNKSDTFFKIQDPSGEVLYTRDGAFKNLDGFLVNSNGHYILNNDNEPISTEEEFVSQIAVVKIDYKELDKYKDNNFKAKEGAFIEGIELNDSEIHQGAIERSNVNSVTAMVGLIDAHRRFEQAQKAVSTIDELNGKLIEKIGNNTRS
jgi:flagellar basal-body rod protein FlgG